MTGPDLPDSGMASGSDAGQPGEHLGAGDLRPDEERLLAELERGVGDTAPAGSEAEVRAAEDEAPLPDEGGPQDDGLEAEFSDPE
ncbi:hypothetical protein SAMN05660657_03102 [Geodermatophilus amargosae]|uniref:Uncharacterized protein n=1 Tax=Geodermatophilus amargosae TaxID=1296565 RepID=A0A1I7AWV2_9ACTN|nr:hypothetical protein [Geodermatophilus amargosae]SFT79386.1 hypothetical protein SAMN05660657_03102 [Geodermatophilus amargosae]